MTTPHVTELPRQLESISADTFLGGREDAPLSPAPPTLAAARELRPLAIVLPMRPRDPLAARRSARRRTRRPPHSGGMPGPGGDAA